MRWHASAKFSWAAEPVALWAKCALPSHTTSAPPAPLSALYRPNGDWEVEPRKDQISIVARTALKLPANSSAPSDEAVELAKVQAG